MMEELKFSLLEQGLMINELKKETDLIEIECYQQLLTTTLVILNTFIASEEWNEEYKHRISKLIGIQI